MPALKRILREKPVTLSLGTGSRWSTFKTGLLSCFLLIALMMVVVSPVLAESAPNSTGGSAARGVLIYWPYHALLMSIGLVLLLAGFITARFHKRGAWYKTHIILEATGGAFLLVGMFIAVYMVTASGFPHLRNAHEILGVLLVILIAVTLVIGFLIRKVNASKNAVRTSHRWLGRISIALAALNIVLGIMILAFILSR